MATHRKIDDRRDGKWDAKLVCHVLSLSYDFETLRGEIRFPEGECCDMTACVNLFKGIDPEVQSIQTYAGGVPDTSYIFDDDGRPGTWEAH